MSQQVPASDSTHLPFVRSLRGKSLLLLGALFTYSLLLAVFIFQQKTALLSQLADIDQLQRQEKALVEADLAAFSAITELFVMSDPGGRQEVLNKVHLQFTELQQRYAVLLELYPDRAPDFRQMLRNLAETLVRPSAANMLALREVLSANKQELDQLLAINRVKHQQALDAYIDKSDWVAQLSLLLAGIGLGLVGWIVAIFFRRQVSDISQIQQRVGEIVDGYRGAPLQNKRDDELGELIVGINRMAGRLREREQELEIERHKQFHVDKMGAIGHLTAGLVHEVGNPVAAIVGLIEECQERHPDDEALAANLQMVADYAERLRKITEDMAAFHHSNQMTGWIDLNEIVKRTENLIHYDERWFQIQLEERLAQQLPAVTGDADQLTQLLMNLVVNALESVERARPEQPKVTVETSLADDGVLLRVVDNGEGLSQEQLPRVFEAFYTTKEEKGTGLGLLLCSSIVSGHGGYIRMLPVTPQGLAVEVYLPIESKRSGSDNPTLEMF